MSWNYRVMAQKSGDEIYFDIREVYYTNDIPDKFSSDPATVGGDNLEEVKEEIKRFEKAVGEPILYWDEATKKIIEYELHT